MRPDETICDNNDNVTDDFDVLTRKGTKAKRNHNEPAIDEDHQYNEYPTDLWWLISDYVAPEDVGRFALICRASYTIAGSVKFWKGIYNRYYSPAIRLPTRLQPDCMARPGGLRACVIRSLYYTYTPFLQRLIKHPQQDFHGMTKRYVERFWFTRKANNKWLYFYKLKRKPIPGSRVAESEALQRCTARSLKSLRDVYMNSEEGCSLLIVSHADRINGSTVIEADFITAQMHLNYYYCNYNFRFKQINFIRCQNYQKTWEVNRILS